MARGTTLALIAVVLSVAAELVAALATLAPVPAQAQLFDDRFMAQRRRPEPPRAPFDFFGTTSPFFQPQPQPVQPTAPAAPRPEPAIDYSKAPAPKKGEPKGDSAGSTIMVLGDSMADWLAYGLELAYADQPDIAVLRRHRTNSGLIRTETREARAEYPDWPVQARDLIANQKPKFVLMMVGVNDRRTIRETAGAARAKPAPTGAQDDAEIDRMAPETPADAPAVPSGPNGNRSLEFRTDSWSDAYIRRIDDTIAALKTSGVPVFWVGLPPLRGQKAGGDVAFLNDLYRSRADRAGIIYIDVWDGFVDEDGRFTPSGPDLEGQTRRLRTGDGVHFTQAGARKLAHYVDREIQRWLAARSGPVAVAVPEEPKPAPAPTTPKVATVTPPAVSGPAANPPATGGRERPLSGPPVALISARPVDSEELLGGNARPPQNDALVTKVLINGEAAAVPAGRADDFSWPRRDILPVGSDPVVATSELPMTPMVADKSSPLPAGSKEVAALSPAAATPPKPVVHRPAPSAPPAQAQAQQQPQSPFQPFQPFRPSFAEAHQAPSPYRPDILRRPPAAPPPTFFPFQALFGNR